MKGSSDMKSSSSATELSDANVPINRSIAQTAGLTIYSNIAKINCNLTDIYLSSTLCPK